VFSAISSVLDVGFGYRLRQEPGAELIGVPGSVLTGTSERQAGFRQLRRLVTGDLADHPRPARMRF
jgi:hypothetical protein